MSPCHLIVLPQPSEQCGGSFGQMCRLTLVEKENPFFPPLCSPQEALCPVFYQTCESKTFETKILFFLCLISSLLEAWLLPKCIQSNA